MITKLHIKKGDQVRVTTGNAKGEEGRIISVDRTKYRAVVEGVNMVSRHVKPSASNPQGGIVKKEASIHISNLALLDPSTKAPSKVGRKADKEGNMVRYFKKSGEVAK